MLPVEEAGAIIRDHLVDGVAPLGAQPGNGLDTDAVFKLFIATLGQGGVECCGKNNIHGISL